LADTTWTKEQLEAISTQGCNLLVAAAAGAGKTAVLVERIIRKITNENDPVDIDKLLVVTFTNAAATEMRERIAEAISVSLDKNAGSKLLQKQLALLNKANITTIHSFCLEVVKNNFHYIGLNPGFRIADETEASLLKIEAIDDLFEEIYSEDALKREFFELLECYGGNRDDQTLKSMVLALYDFVQSYPWPEDWLKEKVDYFNIDDSKCNDFAKTKWGKILLEYISIELKSLVERMEKAISVSSTSQGLEPYLENLLPEKRKIGSLIELCNHIQKTDYIQETNTWDSLYEAFQNITFNRLPRCKKDADKEKQEYVKSLRDEVKDQLKNLQNDIFTTTSREIMEDMKHIYPLLKCLAELVIKFEKKYSDLKRSRSVLDFNDLEHFCLKILTVKDKDGNILPSNVAKGYREKFEEILVDEYQDSNMVQEIILNIISRKDIGKPNIFMVGDVKQSIYRFRQARPELFLEKYNTYSTGDGGMYRKIQLFKNFRSRRNVIDTVNFIFSRIMSEEVGELNYDENEALNFGAVIYDEAACPAGDTGYMDRNTEIHIIDMKDSDKNDTSTDGNVSDETTYADTDFNGNESGTSAENDYNSDGNMTDIYRLFSDEPIDNIKCEARLVAWKIHDLIKSFRVYDNKIKSYRPLEYRDIVILMRSTKDWSDVFVEELSLQGIPVYADTGTGFFKTIEVQIMMSLLQVIDNPLQDIPLLAVLRAPFADFTPEEMADIRLVDKEATLYEALAKASGVEKYIIKYDKGQENPENNQENNNLVNNPSDNNPIDNIDIDEKLREKVVKFLERLEKWRDKASYMSVDELIWYLYNDTGFYSFVGGMPAGEQRQANLRMLFEQARKFEETSYRGLFNFINFINKIKISQGDLGSAKILGENENVVRIMSIHKSKGLEFPVVFVSGCGKGFNLKDLHKNIIFHQELGFGPDYVDHEKRISYPTTAKQALKCQIKKESLSEEMRILYVALTRAKEKLILTGTVKNAKVSMDNWKEQSMLNKEKIPSYIILKGKNFLDWICPALMQKEEHERYIKIWSKEQFENETTGDAESVGNEDNLSNTTDNNNNTSNEVKIGNEDKFNNRDEFNNEGESNIDVNFGKDEFGKEIAYIANKDELIKEIDRRLSWTYKYRNSTVIPVKVSVTELKRRFVSELNDEYPSYQVYTPTLVKKPAFMEKSRGLNSAEIGSVLHFVMQHLDLRYVNSADEIKMQVDKMVENELLTEQQASYVDIKKILRYFSSEIGQRMLNAAKVYREVPFNMQISSKEVMKALTPGKNIPYDIPEEYNYRIPDSMPEKYDIIEKNDKENDGRYETDTILLQGVIDCYFEEDDGLVLLDYKTDYISPSEGIYGIERIKARYATQLYYYQIVLEKLLEQKVKEKYIYLFWNGETIKL